MKQKFSLKLFTLICSLLTMVVKAEGPKTITVTCRMHNYTGSAVFLYKVENGEAVSLGFKRPDADQRCTFSFAVDREAIYCLKKAGSHDATLNHVLYLKPGDKVNVDIYSNYLNTDFDSCKIDHPNKETGYLKKWAALFNPVCKIGFRRENRDTLFKAYDQLVKDAAQLKKNAVSSNSYFNCLFAAKMQTDILYAKAASFFYFGERKNAGYDSSAAHRAFYQELIGKKLGNTSMMYSEHGIQLIDYVLAFNLFQSTGSSEKMLSVPFADKASQLSNDTLKGIYAASRMKQLNSFEQFKKEIEPFKKSIYTAGLGAAYEKRHFDLYTYAQGAPAYNFSLNDRNDHLVSLSDFKGKTVVLDIWAMWCAPCLAEKPNYQKLEEAYKDRDDVVFLGISVDGSAKKEPWKSFVAKKGYTSIELLCEPTESIMKYYRIGGIPRFMIFDKNGNIVTVDAPRPSNPAFKKLIDQTLNNSDHATNPQKN